MVAGVVRAEGTNIAPFDVGARSRGNRRGNRCVFDFLVFDFEASRWWWRSRTPDFSLSSTRRRSRRKRIDYHEEKGPEDWWEQMGPMASKSGGDVDPEREGDAAEGEAKEHSDNQSG